MIPSSLSSLLSSPLARVLVPAIVEATLKSRPLPPGVEDLSVDAFFTQHFGEEFARVLGSALVHGIYAADSATLSVRAAFPSLWDAIQQGKGNVVRGFLRKAMQKSGSGSQEMYELGDLAEKMKGFRVYSFKDGMETLTRALTNYLQSKPNVELVAGEELSALQRVSTDEFDVSVILLRRPKLTFRFRFIWSLGGVYKPPTSSQVFRHAC